MKNPQQHSPRVLGFVGSEDGQQVIVLQEVTDSWITARHGKKREAVVRRSSGIATSPEHPGDAGIHSTQETSLLALGTGVSLRQLRHTHVEGKKLLLKGIL